MGHPSWVFVVVVVSCFTEEIIFGSSPAAGTASSSKSATPWMATCMCTDDLHGAPQQHVMVVIAFITSLATSL
jgi:hypothetical protein